MPKQFQVEVFAQENWHEKSCVQLSDCKILYKKRCKEKLCTKIAT
jgi:hypothetical protein